jgi:antitoxin component YwqK of YwqJK toxin-antitoxin module
MGNIREVFAVFGVVSSLWLACGGERTSVPRWELDSGEQVTPGEEAVPPRSNLAPAPKAPGADPAPDPGEPPSTPPPSLSVCVFQRSYRQDGSLHEEKLLDAHGRMLHWRVLGPNGGTESELFSVYDAAGREVIREEHGPESDPLSTWEYASDGLLLAHYSDYPLTGDLFNYDARGRLLYVEKIRDGEQSSIESFFYDETGLKVEARDTGAGGNLYGITHFDYHENGVLKRSIYYATSHGGSRVETFDSAGRLLSESLSSSEHHATVSSTDYAYDEQGRLTARESYSSEFPYREASQLTTRFTFDDQGRLALQDEVSIEGDRQQPVRQHHTLVFTYSPQLVRVDQYDDNGVPEGSRELSYDASGRVSRELFSGAMALQQRSIDYLYLPCDG